MNIATNVENPKGNVEPCMMVIFGGTGDLSKRKLLPILYKLFARGEWHANGPILCIGRQELARPDFLKKLELERFIKSDNRETFDKFKFLLHYYSMDIKGGACYSCGDCESCNKLKRELAQIKNDHNHHGNIIFYLATSPDYFEDISIVIKESGLLDGDGWKRIAYEKPFGFDLKSAQELNASIRAKFNEDQIYRIDHYLGKALVQAILVLRFSNPLFDQVWNRHFVDHVQITVAENLDMEGTRGRYYEKSGAIRDMLQNHIIQILTLVTMECPPDLTASSIKEVKVNMLKDLNPPMPGDLVVGQYVANNEPGSKNYLEEEGVAPDSKTETYVSVRATFNRDRWQGVPFFIRTGKGLKKSFAQINIVLKDVNAHLFGRIPLQDEHQNVITINIQPTTGVSVQFNIKKPGHDIKMASVSMNYDQGEDLNYYTPEAYESLLQGILRGDQTNFPRWDGIELSWAWIDKLLELKKNCRMTYYKRGSKGPKEADAMLEVDGRQWMNATFYDEPKKPTMPTT